MCFGFCRSVAVRFTAHLRELGDELDALGLAARERRALLAEREIAEADVLQQLQRVMHARMRARRTRRLVDVHREHVADALARAT